MSALLTYFDSRPSKYLLPAFVPLCVHGELLRSGIQQLDGLVCLASQSLSTHTKGTAIPPSQ